MIGLDKAKYKQHFGRVTPTASRNAKDIVIISGNHIVASGSMFIRRVLYGQDQEQVGKIEAHITQIKIKESISDIDKQDLLKILIETFEKLAWANLCHLVKI